MGIDIDNDGKVFDFHPLTTREERKSLDDEALARLRAERRAARKAARQERREARTNLVEKVEVVATAAKLSLYRLALRLGIRLDEDQAIALAVQVAGALLKVPDPDGDGWTLSEVAEEITDVAVERADDWMAWEDLEAPIVSMLQALGIENSHMVGALLSGIEEADRHILAALISGPIEDYFTGLLGEAMDRADVDDPLYRALERLILDLSDD